MLNLLKLFIKPKPKVGMILTYIHFDDYTTIKVLRVSNNNKKVVYSYLKINGNTISIENMYSINWEILLCDYKIKEDKNE